MIVIESPFLVAPGTGSYSLSVYLAGSVIDCLDWRADLLKQLKDTKLLVLNPRQRVPLESGRGSIQQREHVQSVWEARYKGQVDVVVIWLPQEDRDKESLIEYGYALGLRASNPSLTLIAGCHPGYAWSSEVRRRSEVNGRSWPDAVYDSLKDVAKALIELESNHSRVGSTRTWREC